MRIIPTEIPEVLLLEPMVYGDPRGQFFESWNEERFREAGIALHFVQDNFSFSQGGVLRGLHFQHPAGQGKLVSTLRGAIFDVAVDIRLGSPTFGRWVCAQLDSANRRQLFVPPGFAHGFQVLSDEALVHYKCTNFYRPECEATVAWDDPDIGIPWPGAQPVLSQKDRTGVRLRDLPPERQPSYGGPTAGVATALE